MTGVIFKESLCSADLWRAVFCELIGTFLLVYLGLGSSAIVFTRHTYTGEHPDSTAFITAGAFVGIVIGGIVFCLGHISSLINPSFTVAVFILGKISLVRAILFLLIQCLAGYLGVVSLYWTLPVAQKDTFSCSFIADEIRPLQGFAVEAILTALLVFGGLTIVTKFEQTNSPGASAVAIAVLTIVLVAAGAELTGPSLNPG
jgi:glycerol uptake facilitator-like aquaporin